MKKFYIIDIRKRQNSNFNLNSIIDNNSKILSLTPYSSYLLDNISMNYITFHSIISIDEFRERVFNFYKKVENILNIYKDYGYIFRDIALLKNYEIYIEIISEFINNKKSNGYKIVYITDTKKDSIDNFKYNSNLTSGIYYLNIDEVIDINTQDSSFYLFMDLKSKIYKFLYTKNIFTKFFNKNSLFYDHKNFKDFWRNREIKREIKIDKNIDIKNYKEFIKEINPLIESTLFKDLYLNFIKESENKILKSKEIKKSPLLPFVYLSNSNEFIRNLLYKNNSIPRVFYQHGSYLYEHIFFKYNEVSVADINFVYNNYTKNLFLKYGQKKVYSVGSIDFNSKIDNKKLKYDFVYITHCGNYGYGGTYIDGKDSFYSIDGYNIYQRHKKVIELFKNRFKDKKIVIKMQPNITSSMLYIPLLELSKGYKNITIEFFTPLDTLISKSKYIISDYFSSNFTNRELHYKKDIILFSKFPLAIPKNSLKDMEKMFILIESIKDLKDKIENIEKITKNRKRYNELIEYYSSKNCNTKREVLNILEKELNATEPKKKI